MMKKALSDRIQHPQLWAFFLLVLAVFSAYSNVYGNGFLLDDEFLILKNVYLRDVQFLGQLLTSSSTAGAGGVDFFFRPMQGLLYFLIMQTAGPDPAAFHLLNVSLHAANVFLVFMLGRKLGFKDAACFIAALLWGLHPIHTEAVTYISATADPLYAFFCLASLNVLLPLPTLKRSLWAALLYALALFSKETAAPLPALAVICLFLIGNGKLSRATLIKTAPLWSIAVLYAFLRLVVLPHGDFNFYPTTNVYTESFWIRFLTFLATLPLYLRVFLWPTDLHMDRGFPAYTDFFALPVLLGAALFLLMLGFILRPLLTKKTSGLLPAWGAAWFLITHSLHTGLVLPVNALFLEHWLYLPMIGVMLATTESIQRPMPTKSLRPLFLTGIALAHLLAFTTFHQNRVWENPISFYETILRYGEKSAGAHNNLGMAYSDLGDHKKAIEHYKAAIALYDVFSQTHHNLATALLLLKEEGTKEEAKAELQKAIALNPDFFQSYELLAQIYLLEGHQDEAARAHNKANEIVGRLMPGFSLAPLTPRP